MNTPGLWQRYKHKITQLITFAVILLGLWLIASAVSQNLESRGISTGFGFLSERAGFDLGESLIAYDGDDSYGRALLAGTSNTLKVALVSMLGAIVLGVMAAAAMLSGHSAASRIAGLYVGIVRNTPLLLQLFFWFSFFTVSMPGPRNTLQPLPHVYVSNRGINFPSLDATLWLLLCLSVLTFCAALWISHRRRMAGKSSFLTVLIGLAVLLGLLPLAQQLGIGNLEIPSSGKFSISGGAVITPEFMTLFAGLSFYTGTYIAEALRGAVQTVPRGQNEAAAALGLNAGYRLRLVVMPQATRIAFPSLVSEILNLVKNSSLGVAIGYPDLVSAGNTTMNQTGQAIELIAIYMLVYVSINVVITRISKYMESRYAW